MRTILHSDINNCYASIECRDRPELQGQPVAVAGDPEKRHGIILAKNEVAKRCGVQTAEPIWQARKKCPALIVLPPRFDVYWQVSRQVREIYRQYTDQVEMFSIDEAWLDVTASRAVRGDGEQIAQDIRRRIRREIGVTVSVGVSFNKVFAKLASEQKKPDAVTVIPRGEFRRLVWPLPVRELLYVGPATERKLAACGIDTIGRLAGTPPEVLASLLGKMGRTLYSYANGQDQAPVRRDGESDPVKSIGQSVTTVEDLTGRGDVQVLFSLLAESVAFRLRRHGLRCRGVQIYLRDQYLLGRERQCICPQSLVLAEEIEGAALALYDRHFAAPAGPWRSAGIRVFELERDAHTQISLLPDQQLRLRREGLAQTVDRLREKYGFCCVQRGWALTGRARQLTGAALTPGQKGFFPCG